MKLLKSSLIHCVTVLCTISFLVISYTMIASATVISPGFSPAPMPTVTLQPVKLAGFAVPPPIRNSTVTPSIFDKKFPLRQAVNYAEVIQTVGQLTPAQEKFLETNRFLLIPKKNFLYFDTYNSMATINEMLHNFDSIGGSYDPYQRRPENAVFINPDVFLHTLHNYFANCLKFMESRHLSKTLVYFLTEYYNNIAYLHSISKGESTPHWERLKAQAIIPLILMSNVAQQDSWQENDQTQEQDTLENALAIFASHKDEFSEETSQRIETELTRIYAAEQAEQSLLGLISFSGTTIDYTQFRPRSHYESDATLRAYFRTMIWLGQLGWDLQEQNGLIDSINYALAMSLELPAGAARAFAMQEESTDQNTNESTRKFASLRDAWQYIMEITAFFAGYPDEASYLEWQPFLLTHAKVDAFTPSTAINPLVQQRLKSKLDQLKPSIPFFSQLYNPEAKSVLRIMPQRFTAAWLIADELTWKEKPQKVHLPVLFSSLWIAGTLGNTYAQEQIAKQAALCLDGTPTATEEGGSVPVTNSTTSVDKEQLTLAITTLQTEQARLYKELQQQPQSSWFSSLGAAWFQLLATLTADYGQGYPLYMQSKPFRAKQLETLLASYTELKHDTVLYEKPNYAEAGEGGEVDTLPPIPKGFVEPNLAFWNEMLRLTIYIEQGFKFYGLFPQHTEEEYGMLNRFKTALAFCLSVAEKELQNRPISEEEYEQIRLMQLEYMTMDPSDGNIRTFEQQQSALIVDIHTANMSDMGKPPVITYDATAEPSIMLVLVGNENTPRITVGMAYNHYEFIAPFGKRITDSMWRHRVYSHYSWETGSLPEEDNSDTTSQVTPVDLPQKNFWYDILHP